MPARAASVPAVRAAQPRSPTRGPWGRAAQPSREESGWAPLCRVPEDHVPCLGRSPFLGPSSVDFIGLGQFRSQGRARSRCPPGPGGQDAGPARVPGSASPPIAGAGPLHPPLRGQCTTALSAQTCECSLHPVADPLHRATHQISKRFMKGIARGEGHSPGAPVGKPAKKTQSRCSFFPMSPSSSEHRTLLCIEVAQ